MNGRSGLDKRGRSLLRRPSPAVSNPVACRFAGAGSRSASCYTGVDADVVPAVECSGLAECLVDLSDEESRDLVRTLRPGVKASLL